MILRLVLNPGIIPKNILRVQGHPVLFNIRIWRSFCHSKKSSHSLSKKVLVSLITLVICSVGVWNLTINGHSFKHYSLYKTLAQTHKQVMFLKVKCNDNKLTLFAHPIKVNESNKRCSTTQTLVQSLSISKI